MGKHKVLIFPMAQKDLRNIVAYINTFSFESAKRQYESIVSQIKTLRENPKKCPIAKDELLSLKNYRISVTIGFAN